MSQEDPYKIFVTHTFQEHEEYAQVFEYLEARDNFFYQNFSDPEVRLEGGGEEALQELIRQQIRPVEIVLFPAGIYGQNPRLIDFQLKVAQAFKKPIVTIKSFGGTQVLPRETEEVATDTIEWNDRVITDAIRRIGRGEDTAMWDVIEFDPDC